jgi:hypothetical protein
MKTTALTNPRYICYARAHGRDPEAMLQHDTDAWPGGCMAGFIGWIGEQWRTWRTETEAPEPPFSDSQHAAFDQWLQERTP